MPISKITGQSIEDGSIVLADLGITTFNTGAGNTLTLQANSATGITIDVTGNTAIANTLTFSSTGARIRGDFSNGTVANRVMFQTSTANSATSLYVIPSGTSTTSQFVAVSNSDPTNASILQLLALSTESQIRAGITGSGTLLPLTMYTGGSERLRIDTSGNVGIGLTPSTKLDVSGIITSRGSGNAARFSTVDTDVGGATILVNAAFAGAGTPAIQTQTNHPILFATNNTERMRISSAGRLGIGTDTPSQLLHVAAGNILTSNTAGTIATVSIAGNGSTVGTSDFALQQGTSSEAYVYNRANSYLVLGTNNTERMRITSAGRVGIGTTDIGYKLVVAGTAGDATISLLESGVRSWGIRAGGATTNTFDITDFNAGTSRLLIDASGNVGIGTSSPANRLHVYTGASGRSSFDSRYKSILENNGETYLALSVPDNSFTGIRFLNATGANSGMGAVDYWMTDNLLVLNSTTGGIRFNTNSGERMRITSGGNVGIGTNSPPAKLSVKVASSGGGTSLGGWDQHFVVSTGDTSSSLGFGVGINTTSEISHLYSAVPTARWTSMWFHANDYAWYTGGSERMRITSAGNVGIGTSSPQRPLHVVEGGYFGNVGTDGGTSYVGTTPILSVSTDGNGVASSNYATNAVFVVGIGGNSTGTTTTQHFRVNLNGNVGIGTTSPGERLTVSGRKSLLKPANPADGRCVEFFTAIAASTTAANLFDATCRTGNEGFYYEIIVTGGDWNNNSAARVIKRGFHNPNASYTEHSVVENAGPMASTIVYEYTKSTNTFTGRLRLTSGDPVTLKVYVKLIGCLNSYAVYGTE